MKRIHKDQAERQAAYRERKKKKQELAADQADEIAVVRGLNLCGFSEIAFDTPARTREEEIQIHRSWLRALEQPDVLPGETLRQLAKRTWDALLTSKGFGVITDGDGKWVDGKWLTGFDVWYPLFSPSQQHFQVPFDSNRYPGGPFGEAIRGAAHPDWFDTHWVPPGDCTGDEPIDIKHLPPLPPIPSTAPKKPEQKAKTDRVPSPTITGYETPAEEQNRLIGFGTFGMTRASHS